MCPGTNLRGPFRGPHYERLLSKNYLFKRTFCAGTRKWTRKCPNNLNRPHFPGVFSYKCPHKCAAVSARTHTHTHPYTWDFKQRVRKGLVRWPEVIFSPPVNASKSGSLTYNCTTTALAVETTFKSVFAFFYCLSRLFQNVGELLRSWNRAVTPHGKAMLKNYIHKKVRCMSKFRTCLCSHHLVRRYPL